MTSLNDPRIAALEVTPIWAGSLAIADVDKALTDAGLDSAQLPKTPSRALCMKRAFEHTSPRGARIDMLAKGLGVAMSLKDVKMLDLEALAQQTGQVVREAASYHATLTAKITVINTQGTEIETLSFSPDDHPMVDLARATYHAMREQYKASEDLSIWFSQTIIPLVGGVGKRSRGGVYYVAAKHRDIIDKVATGLAAVSQSTEIERQVNGVRCPVQRLIHGGKLCLEPRFADDSFAMEIMIDGVIRDADSAIDHLAAELGNESGKPPPGKRALATRRAECEKLENQIKAWEQVCSMSLPLLQNRLAEVQAGIGAAEMAADLDDLKND